MRRTNRTIAVAATSVTVLIGFSPGSAQAASQVELYNSRGVSASGGGSRCFTSATSQTCESMDVSASEQAELSGGRTVFNYVVIYYLSRTYAKDGSLVSSTEREGTAYGPAVNLSLNGALNSGTVEGWVDYEECTYTALTSSCTMGTGPVDVSWQGTGDTRRTTGTVTLHEGNYRFVAHGSSASRSAVTSGRIAGVDVPASDNWGRLLRSRDVGHSFLRG